MDVNMSENKINYIDIQKMIFIYNALLSQDGPLDYIKERIHLNLYRVIKSKY